MAGRSYDRLGIEAFGQHLLKSGDLDPVYIALVGMEVGERQLARWLVAYWCFYACGEASYLSELEGLAFWDAMSTAAANSSSTPIGTRWYRAHERRHFRGKAALEAVRRLREQYGAEPEGMLDFVTLRGKGGSVGEIMRRVKHHHLFGNWIGFKVADMVERILQVPVDFTEGAVFMFADPVKAAKMLWEEEHGLPRGSVKSLKTEALHQVVEHLKQAFAGTVEPILAPPHYDRPVDLQEVETVLCKWKSHLNGHYPLWNDVDAINKQVDPWTNSCKTARRFREAMPERIAEEIT